MEKIKASPETKIEELNLSEACGNHGWFPKSLPFAQGIDIRNSSQALQCGVKNDQPTGFPDCFCRAIKIRPSWHRGQRLQKARLK